MAGPAAAMPMVTTPSPSASSSWTAVPIVDGGAVSTGSLAVAVSAGSLAVAVSAGSLAVAVSAGSLAVAVSAGSLAVAVAAPDSSSSPPHADTTSARAATPANRRRRTGEVVGRMVIGWYPPCGSVLFGLMV